VVVAWLVTVIPGPSAPFDDDVDETRRTGGLGEEVLAVDETGCGMTAGKSGWKNLDVDEALCCGVGAVLRGCWLFFPLSSICFAVVLVPSLCSLGEVMSCHASLQRAQTAGEREIEMSECEYIVGCVTVLCRVVLHGVDHLSLHPLYRTNTLSTSTLITCAHSQWLAESRQSTHSSTLNTRELRSVSLTCCCCSSVDLFSDCSTTEGVEVGAGQVPACRSLP
jgi:hypothetical protein